VAAAAGGFDVTTEAAKPGLVDKGTPVLDAGTRLGEYEVERLLGVGSMGAVYEGVCTATGQRYAIKVLSPTLAALPSARARFLNEAKLTARVRHPHIVDVSDVGEDGGRSFFVMELLNGEDLSRRLARSGRLSVLETADIMVPVCDAVAEAHRRGITHRDLKPSNIFLLVRGRRPHPVVLDFGVAKEDDGAAAPSAGIAAPVGRMVFGTPYYLAPEQVANHEAAGPASDQYALGVILYECLTGQPPYRGDNIDQVFRAIAAGNAVPPLALRPDLPAELNAIVLRALNPDPKARYFSVAELRHALVPFSSKGAGAQVAAKGEAQPAVAKAEVQSIAPVLAKAEVQPAAPIAPAIEAAAVAPRAPVSPAIENEAKTPSPFVRTLTPEVEALDGAWFAAGEDKEPSVRKTTIGMAVPELLPIAAGREAEWEPSGATVPPVEVEHAAPAAGKLVPRRIWIGAAAAAAVASFVVAFAVKSGRADRSEILPAATAAVVQVEPAPAPSEAPAAAVAPTPSEPPPVAAAPSEPPAAPAAPTPAPSEPPPVAAAPTPAASEPARSQSAAVAPSEAPTAAAPRAPVAPSEPAAPRAPSEPPAAPEPAAAPPAPEVRAASAARRTRKPSEKPRASASAGVRMHNGVPLLD
jgi:serine/threonine-protein kinase